MHLTIRRMPRILPLDVQRGVGLIEVLIAVVVIAIGFLAAARMQVISMRYSQSAYFESQAYFMAGDMVDRMRANVEGVKAGAYDSLTTSASAVSPGCDTRLCTPEELAQQDIYDWSQFLWSGTTNVSALLPSDGAVTAAGSVTRTADGQYSITVNWADEYDTDDGTGTLRVDISTES